MSDIVENKNCEIKRFIIKIESLFYLLIFFLISQRFFGPNAVDVVNQLTIDAVKIRIALNCYHKNSLFSQPRLIYSDLHRSPLAFFLLSVFTE